MRYAVVMAGGSGTRLWPMSVKALPKQLIPFINGRSLLQIAVDRLDGLVDSDKQMICTGEPFRVPLESAMGDFPSEQILFEPTGRDTLNAVGFPAAILSKTDPDATIAIFTADHLIEPIEVFQQRVTVGFDLVDKHPDTLVTFGIQPTWAATGFGYVETDDIIEGFEGAFNVPQFREKPDADTAKQYVESGKFFWNSGMFVWKAGTLMDCIKRYQPEAYEGLSKIGDAWGTDAFESTLSEIYPQLPKISVDYAIMENASKDDSVNIACVNMPVDWKDVGSWPAYGETLEPDATGNLVAAENAMLMNTSDTLIVSDQPEKLISTLGVKDLIIIQTEDSILIAHKDAAQDIKQMQAEVSETFDGKYI